MPHHRYFIHLSYKGTNYFGWQIQPNHKSVQETIEQALTQINSNQKIDITGCGRTDTGVHASDYYAHVDCDLEFDCEQMKFKLNLMLPKDIAIHSIFKVDPSKHARHSATSRTYEYRIHQSKNPFLAETSWLYAQKLNCQLINEACQLLMKQHDFESFSKVKTSVDHFICNIEKANWTETKDGYQFTITANRFLRGMVRTIMGTLVDVGLEKITPKEFEEIILSKNRNKAGKAAPAEGLTLTKVTYPFLT